MNNRVVGVRLLVKLMFRCAASGLLTRDVELSKIVPFASRLVKITIVSIIIEND